MRAAVFVEPHVFDVREVPEPVVGPGEVLVRTAIAGICGSDVHIVAGSVPQVLPRISGKVLGHELCGRVVEVAPDVTKVKPGDRVAIEPLVTCGACVACRTGQYHLCPDLQHIGMTWSGGFGELAKAPQENVYHLPDSVSDEDASLLDGLAVGIHAVHRTGVRLGSTVFVFGGGAIGLATAHAAKWAGASLVALATRSETARSLAQQTGIDVTIDSSREDVDQRVREITDGLGVDVAFDAVGGTKRYVQRGIDQVRPGGKVGVMAVFPEQRVDLGRSYIRKEVDLIACFSYAMWGSESEFQLAIDGLATGKLFGHPYITHRFPLDEISHAFDVAAHKDGQDAIKVSIVY
jgi:2-desacetyl-2-hydroxyethyl bacteriochlorophyllide A dehydrogenase